ncbi:MAG: shikimate dehydrogenase [Candidatus Omnitrophota bacterium]|nr:shikimate dehydrogenase [Candidatus Omnitrophota bacterium]
MNIYGVIGWPIKHSLSPAMHNAAFKELGIDAEYKLFEVSPEKLEDFILNKKDVAGFNITIPHKVRAREVLKNKFKVVNNLSYPHYDEMSGAVNTVKRNGDDIEYCNTDPVGFRHSLENDLKFKTKDKNALIIGCGGASRAIVADLSYSGHHIKKIYLYDINKEAVESTKRQYSNLKNKIKFIYDTKEMLKLKDEFDLLVNASPVGMEEGDERLAVPKELLRKELYVFDLVYNRKTRLFKEAAALGCHVVDGSGMLAAQGAFSFSLWTGVPAVKVLETMRTALNKALRLQTDNVSL